MNPVVLRQKITAIDCQDYGAYQSLIGDYHYPDFILTIQQIPKDPYAPPHTGIYRIQIKRDDPRFISWDIQTKLQSIAFADYLARRFFAASATIASGNRGTGHSGLITINPPAQVILERNSVIINEDRIEIRAFVGLPANGRQINGQLATTMLLTELPDIINQALLADHDKAGALRRHIHTTEDADVLRHQLSGLGLVAFIANGAILPRASGTSDQPLNDHVIPFQSPDSMQVTIDCPHAGPISGMGIPTGITLITGGGYHGKSTLLHTIESGIYNHIPDDGREYCVSDPTAVKVRAYSGRFVQSVDISPFIQNLPYGKDTTRFSSENASGSTSQAASIMEAIEAGGSTLLMDEDTCATNFMIRDAKMQQLVKKADEPITTFIDRIRPLVDDLGISTVLVLGGVGDYFDVCDQVIQMVNYQPIDVTGKARQIAGQSPVKRHSESTGFHFTSVNRWPVGESVSGENAYGKFSVYAKEIDRIHFGQYEIDLTDVEQLVDVSQTKALAFALNYATRYMDGKMDLKTICQTVEKDILTHSLDIINDRISGHFAWFRPIELAMVINRFRGLQIL